MKTQYFPEVFHKPADFLSYNEYNCISNNYFLMLGTLLGFSRDRKPNQILLKCPEKIIYTLTYRELLYFFKILPLCILDFVTKERTIEFSKKENSFYIRKTDSTTWHKAFWPVETPTVAICSYVDKETGETVESTVTTSMELVYNLLDNIEIVFTSGRYEIYCERAAIESNHCFVDITVEITDTVVKDL